MRTRTLANVTAWAPERIAARRRALVAAFGTTDDDTMAVTVDEPLAAWSRLCWLSDQVRGTAITRLPSPDARQAAMLHAVGTPLPRARSVSMMSADGLSPCMHRLVNQMSGVQEKTGAEQRERSVKGSSRMTGNFHVRLLGEEAAVMPASSPDLGLTTINRARYQKNITN